MTKAEKYGIRGIMAASVTPFTKTGAIDEDAFRRHLDYLAQHRVHGVVVCGSLGEFPAMTPDERNRLVKIAVEEARGRMLVSAGTGAVTTMDAIELTRAAKDLGADMAQIVTPYYLKPSPEELVGHYAAISKAVALPIVIYNIPDRTGVNVTPALAARLGRIPHVVGMKDSAKDMVQMMDFIRVAGDRLGLLCGNDQLLLPAFFMGAAGSTSGSPNVVPWLAVGIWNHFHRKEYDRARKLQFELNHFGTLYNLRVTQPALLKSALAVLGRNAGVPRLPARPLSGKNLAAVRSVLKAVAGNRVRR